MMTKFTDLVPSAPAGRFDGIERPYTPEDVLQLRGSVQIHWARCWATSGRRCRRLHPPAVGRRGVSSVFCARLFLRPVTYCCLLLLVSYKA